MDAGVHAALANMQQGLQGMESVNPVHESASAWSGNESVWRRRHTLWCLCMPCSHHACKILSVWQGQQICMQG